MQKFLSANNDHFFRSGCIVTFYGFTDSAELLDFISDPVISPYAALKIHHWTNGCNATAVQSSFFFQNTISPLWMSGLSLLNHSTVNRSCFCRFTSWGSERWNGGYCKKGSGGEKTSVRSESEMKCFSISDIDKKLISDIPNKNVCSCLTLSDLN